MPEVRGFNGEKITVRTTVDLAYVIQGDDEGRSVKVGRSKFPDRRVAGLVSGVPFSARLVAILDKGTVREREMKSLLAPHRLRGEWFSPAADLDEYLRAARRQNGLLIKRPIDADFFEKLIRPGILEYFNGREPKLSEYGDFAFRVLHSGLPAIGARIAWLLSACPNTFTPELLAGYVPLEIGHETPSVMPARTPEPRSAA